MTPNGPIQPQQPPCALDPLLSPSDSRFTLFPIKYDKLWALYKKAESSFWVAAEVDLSLDGFDDLTPNEQHFVKHVLAFFAAADGVVMENLCGGFMNDVQVAEARAFYAFQSAMEQIHSETYSVLIDTYVRDPKEKTVLFNAIESFPCVRKKYDWARQYMGPVVTLPTTTTCASAHATLALLV